MDKPQTKRIFISYPHAPKRHASVVKEIVRILEAKGFSVWFDESEIKSGDDWRDKIVEGVLGSDWIVAVLTKHSVRQPGVCLNELQLALHHKAGDEALFTILLENPSEVRPPLTLSHVQWLDISEFEAHYPQNMGDSDQFKHWRNWIHKKTNQLVLHLETKKPVLGEINTLFDVLKPLNFVAEIAHKSHGFVGREWLIERLLKKSNSNKRVLVIQAPAGFGKSAFLANFAHQRDDVIGMHFCKWNDVVTQNAEKLVVTMAFQLASRVPSYRTLLINVLEKKFKNEPIQNWPAVSLFRELVLNLVAEPVDIDGKGRAHQYYLIDGLDETLSHGGSRDIVNLISNEFYKLPSWISVVVTTRPDLRIEGLLPPSVVVEFEHQQVFDDAAKFFKNALISKEHDPVILAKSVGGNMLIASQLATQMNDSESDEELEVSNLSSLEPVYAGFVRRNFSSFTASSSMTRSILTLLASSPLPLPEKLIMRLLNLSRETFNQEMIPISSLLIRKGCGDYVTYELFHLSIAEWFISPSRPHEYQLDCNASQLLSDYFVERICDGRRNGLIDSFDLEFAAEFLPHTLPKSSYWNDAKELRELWMVLGSVGYYFAAANLSKRYFVLSDSFVAQLDKPRFNERLLQIDFFNKAGFFNAAQELCDKLLERQKTYASSHDDWSIDIVEKCAEICIFRREFVYAHAYLKDILLIRRATSVKASTRFKLNNTLNNCATCLLEMGRLDEALVIQRELLSEHTVSFGECHQLTVKAASNLALTLLELEKYEESKALLERVVEFYIEQFGGDHPSSLRALNNLSELLYRMGDIEDSIALQESVLQLREAVLGENHPDTLKTCSELEQKRHQVTVLDPL